MKKYHAKVHHHLEKARHHHEKAMEAMKGITGESVKKKHRGEKRPKKSVEAKPVSHKKEHAKKKHNPY